MTEELEDHMALYFVGGRITNQPTNATDSYKYNVPADMGIRFPGEKKGGAVDYEVKDLLDLWADWMRKPEKLADDFPEDCQAQGFIPTWRKDFEEMVAAADADQLERINAAFDSLDTIYKQAIFRHYGLSSQVWRFAKDASFEDALVVIRVKFVAKGLL